MTASSRIVRRGWPSPRRLNRVFGYLVCRSRCSRFQPPIFKYDFNFPRRLIALTLSHPFGDCLVPRQVANAWLSAALGDQTTIKFVNRNEDAFAYMQTFDQLHSDMDMFLDTMGEDLVIAIGNVECVNSTIKQIIQRIPHICLHILSSRVQLS